MEEKSFKKLEFGQDLSSDLHQNQDSTATTQKIYKQCPLTLSLKMYADGSVHPIDAIASANLYCHVS